MGHQHSLCLVGPLHRSPVDGGVVGTSVGAVVKAERSTIEVKVSPRQPRVVASMTGAWTRLHRPRQKTRLLTLCRKLHWGAVMRNRHNVRQTPLPETGNVS
eukprot:52950-Eustigmatos_ZCMA.PRE.1